jgi:hypothetical protein
MKIVHSGIKTALRNSSEQEKYEVHYPEKAHSGK